MSRSLDPLAGAARLLVDGTNLLHALGRGPAPLPAAAITGRLRAIVPPAVAVVVVLDGSPAPGAIGRRIASGVEVRYAGSRSADDLLRELVAPSPDGTVVVTDDIELAGSLRAMGARTAHAAWLVGRLARQRLQAPAAVAPDQGSALERPPWRPGRGATRKRGNPRRGRPRP
jgi:hypothetical protein